MHWIRLWVDHIINGTTFDELDAEQRGVWFTMLVMAGYSPVPGTICVAPCIPYTDEQISGITKLPLEVIRRSIEHLCSETVTKLTRNPDGTLSITKWSDYQTEYQRQKPFRRGLQGKVTNKGYTETLQAQSVSVSVSVSDTSSVSSKGNEDFEKAWTLYPKRSGGNPKRDAERAWNARIEAGVSADLMLVGVARYGSYCEAAGTIGTEYVMQAKRFFGPSEPFSEEWAAPKERNQTGGKKTVEDYRQNLRNSIEGKPRKLTHVD